MNNLEVTTVSNKAFTNNKLSDEGLVRLIVGEKEEGAFKTLVNRYASRTYYLVLIFTLNHKLAKKVTKDVFLSLKALDADDTLQDFKTWLYALTFSKIRTYLKDPEATHEEQVIDKDQEIQERMFPENGFDIKEGLFYSFGYKSSEFIPIIEKALYELPPPYRVAVYLCDIEKMSLESIQTVLGFSGPTIEFMIYNSRLYIMQQLSDYIKENGVL